VGLGPDEARHWCAVLLPFREKVPFAAAEGGRGGHPPPDPASQGHPRLRGGRLLSRKGRGGAAERARAVRPRPGVWSSDGSKIPFETPAARAPQDKLIEGRETPKRSIILVWRAFRRPRDASPPSSSGSTRGPRPRCTTSGLPRHGRRFWTGPAARHGTSGLAEASPGPSRDGSTPPASRPLSHAALAPGPYYPEGGAGPASRVRVRETRPQAPHPLPLP
jgi:hypothetical protein